MINYSISLRANPSDQDAPKKAYANAQYSEIMTLDKFAEAYLDPRLQIQPCRHPGGPDPSGGLHAGAASGRTTHPDGRSGHFLHSYQQHGSRITGDIQSRHPCGRPERALESRDPFPQLAERQRIQPGPYPKGCQAGG